MDRGRRSGSAGPDSHRSHSLQSPFLSSSPLADQFLARDIAECEDDTENDSTIDDVSEAEHLYGHRTFRRLSGVAYGPSRPVLSSQVGDEASRTPLTRKASRDAERSLLRDNHLLPPKHKVKSQNIFARIYRSLFSTKVPSHDTENGVAAHRVPSETSPLLNGHGYTGGPPSADSDEVDEQWEQAVVAGRIQTTWQREAKTVATYSGPLIITFFLQYSINVASIFAVGRIGKIELGAVSLANMSMAISCLAPFQGLATSLDTLCAQAYGSGHKHLVGLQFQRMACFLLLLSIPVSGLFLFGESILRHLVPEPESARLAGDYLKVMIFAIPGIILFECGKRFTQAQGLFQATTYVLIIVAPFNIFLNWLLVWRLGYGFIGAPIAVAVSESLLPIFLFLYVKFVDGSQCWGGFSKRAFTNWWVMIRLALPGMIMVEAEWLAFEIITLFSARFGPEFLAAQSVLATLTTISYQIPFPVSIAASTRIANLIGAGLPNAAKKTALVTFVITCILGLMNVTIFLAARYHLPLLFTSDADVVELVAKVLPTVAVMQVFDGLASGAHGILRGIGKQSIGGPANLIAYYVISLPLGLAMAFGLDWKLEGLWVGVTIGLIIISTFEYIYLMRTDWHQAAVEAQVRNEAG